MSKLDQKFVDNLQQFTNALENIVILLQDQTKKSGTAGATDNVNSMLGNINNEQLTKIVSDLESIEKRSKNIETNTDKILAEVKDARKAKEAGMFGKIKDPKNKAKIVDGIKVVTLIAGSVLAMGLAFKIIGKVNFMSVVGLSIAMVMLAKSFETIGKTKGLSPKKALLIGAVMLGMSAAMLGSAYILSSMPSLSFMQMLTIGAIGISLGIASWGIMMGLKNFKPKDMWLVGAIPLLIPAIAGGILAAGSILGQLKPLSFGSMLSAIMIGVALIPISFAFSILSKGLKDVDWKTVLFASLAIPIMALTIVGASYAFQKIQPIKNPVDVAITSLAIGLSILALTPAFIFLSKSKLDAKGLLFGTLAVITISIAIMASSWILSVGNYKNAPTLEWAAGVGLSLLSFVPSVIALGFIAMSGLGIGAILLGALCVPIVAAVILATSYILGAGKYDKYPTAGWAAGVGLSMLSFMIPMVALGTLIMGTFGIGALILLAGGGAILGIAALMVDISNKFSGTSFTAYPSSAWVTGVGGALLLFSQQLANIKFGVFDFIKVKALGNGIIGLAEKFNENAALFNSPNIQWTTNLKNVLELFNNLPSGNKADGLNSIINTLSRLATVSIVNILPINMLAKSIGKLSDSLENLNTDSINKLLKLSGGVMVLSLIDQIKLTQVLEALDEKRQELSMVFDDKSSPFIDAILSISGNKGVSKGGNVNKVVESKPITKPIENNEELSVLKDISNKLDIITTKLEKVEKANAVGGNSMY